MSAANSSAARFDTAAPIVTMWNATWSSSPDCTERTKSAMQRNGASRWRGNEKRSHSPDRLSSFQMTMSSPSALAANHP